ncbi:MAG TPA: DUF4870 domain-containing protein [Acidobacteriota bacterium]|nr:DUF4870 domain-containing protein [Acidobacteriota bacterium]
MPEDTPPQTPPPPSSPPPPESSAPPPPSGGSSGGGDNRTVMLVLSYVYILALVPLLVEKEDAEVQWHAKNGLCILGTEIVAWIVLTILQFVPVLGWILGCGLIPILFLGFLVLRIIAIVKATKGQRLVVPVVSDFANKF